MSSAGEYPPALMEDTTHHELPLYSGEFEKVTEIHTDDHQITDNDIHVLATDGVFCCTAVCLYDRATGARGLSHTFPSSIDGSTDPEVQALAAELDGDMELEVTYLQGRHTDPAHHEASRSTLHSETDADIVQEDVLYGDPSASLGIDSKGDRYRYDPRLAYTPE